MKNPIVISYRHRMHPASKGFTLMETVIAIGVLAVLLTGFLAVFTPAAQGIRRSISSQQADRLATGLEQELVTLRPGQETGTIKTGFDKGFEWIKDAGNPNSALFVYQYRGDISSLRTDGTPEPMDAIEGQPGVDYVIQSMVRKANDPEFTEDLQAIEGTIFYVKPTQLIRNEDKMSLGKIGEISNPKGENPAKASSASEYKDAVITFTAEFYGVPTKASSYLTGTKFRDRFNSARNPIFTRNLAIRR
ncbi:prepilin-type N-terminal cleavage/methylation domain-containing protein [Luteolibacter algae]|uniref:Prepilin-type N-terminal cleavage/methylation domain-containing protein n=1 Tax=Luteolibacter algae TaxID=454151 RepID=A0ABW5D8J0_9BACT